jgi:MFS family permease
MLLTAPWDSHWVIVVNEMGTGTMTIEARTIQKVRIRILPFVFLLFVIALLDRLNIGFAALTMNKELAISSQQYGLIFGVFFFGYFVFEIPSNLLLHKIGARVWIARILISWGIVAMLTGFAQNVSQLYVARFLLGLAEAGYFPGMALYLTYWFPQREQARALALLIAANPVTAITGISGFGSHPGSRALVRRQQLAVALGLGRNSSHRWRIFDLLSTAKPPPGSQVSDRK